MKFYLTSSSFPYSISRERVLQKYPCLLDKKYKVKDGWIEISSIKMLLKMIDEIKQEIIISPICRNGDMYYELEIYDDYRE